MKLAMMGSGGVGGYFGGRLAAQGYDVWFVARGSHLAALRADGLTIESGLAPLHLKPVRVTEDPAGIGPVDYVLLSVKLWDTEAALAQIKPLIGPGTAVISFQNGVDAEPLLVERLGAAHVMGGIAQIGATIARPGVIAHTGTMQRLVFGELDGTRSARAQAIAAEFQKGKFTTVLSERIVPEMWEKFVMLTTLASITTLTHSNLGQILEAPEGERTILALLAECEGVAKANGYAVSPEAAARTRGLLTTRGPPFTASTQTDMDAGGRTEGDHIVGDMVRRAAAKGVATPLLKVALCNLQVYELKRAKRT